MNETIPDICTTTIPGKVFQESADWSRFSTEYYPVSSHHDAGHRRINEIFLDTTWNTHEIKHIQFNHDEAIRKYEQTVLILCFKTNFIILSISKLCMVDSV